MTHGAQLGTSVSRPSMTFPTRRTQQIRSMASDACHRIAWSNLARSVTSTMQLGRLARR